MPKTRFQTANRAFALLSLFALAACSAAPTDSTSDPTTTGSTTTGSTQGAPLPAPGSATGGASGGASDGASDGASTGGSTGGTATPGAPATDAPPASAPGAGSGPAGSLPYRGVNLTGAEFGALPGVDGRDYGFPDPSEVDYYMSKGMSTFRVGFRWERLQTVAYGELDATYDAKLHAIVSYATSKGATVILNPANFARYYGVTVGSTQVPSAVFADFWRRVASEWASDPKVMFNLVNEPHDIPSEQWVDAANAAIAAIREVGAANAVVVPGNGWTGAHSWNSSYYGTPNTVAMLKISDPASNVIFEAHQYMDATAGGTTGQCMSKTVGSERLEPFVKWLRENHLRGMVGEFAGGKNATCDAAVRDMLTYMQSNSDVLVGWQWWAAGRRWGVYEFSLEPNAGNDQLQMSWLTPFLGELTSTR